MTETFGIAAFRSRQQVLRFEAHLRKRRIACSVISTPREVAVGCGLSVRFNMADLQAVIREYRALQPGNLIGIYSVENMGGARPKLSPVYIEGR